MARKTKADKVRKNRLITLVVLTGILLAILAFMYWQENNKDSLTEEINNGLPSMPINKPTTDKTVDLVEYCLPTEKLCFMKPEDWKVSYSGEDTPVEGGVLGYESAVFSNAADEPVLYVSAGSLGVGGVCIPSESRKVTVLESQPTDVIGDFLRFVNTDNNADQAHAVKQIDADSSTGEYLPSMYLSTALAALKPSQKPHCELMYADFIAGKTTKDDFSTNVSVSTRSLLALPDGSQPKTEKFTSYDEALDYLNSPEQKQIYEVIKSANYKQTDS